MTDMRSELAALRAELRAARRRAAAEAAGDPTEQVLEALRQRALDGDVAACREWLTAAAFTRKVEELERILEARR